MTKKNSIFVCIEHADLKFSACLLTLCYFQNIFKDDIRHLFF